MNKIVTLNALRGNNYTHFRKIPLMINMGVCALCFAPALVFADNANDMTVLNAQQQTRQAVGVVTDKTGEPIIGANVIVKGTTNGTITDLDGNFKLDNVPMNATLQFSYIGFNTQDIQFTGQPSINIQLVDDTQALDEVVVTALGIKREKKALGYSMTELKADELTQTRDVNIANGLAGKVAGVQIKQSGTGAMGSTRIVIRGNNSIGGKNQPLVVVDGVPIDNSTGEGQSDDFWGNSKVDRGSGISDISPDDIESMSVLKGPAAAALYGSRAGNGVIMITTKKGALNKGVGITLNSNLTFDSPMQTPEFQNEYGQGTSGGFDNNSALSWGAKMDGSIQDMSLGKFAYSARDNNLYKDFLRTGTTWTNSVDLSKGSEDMTFRAGVTRMDNKSFVPNSGSDRTSINLRSTAKMANWLSADMKVTYINQHTKNRIAVAADPNNIFYDNLQRPRSIGFSDYAGYRDTNWAREDGKPAAYLRTHNSAPRNVFWSTERNTNNDKKDRFLGFAALDFTFTDWLSLKLRSGIDTYTFTFEDIEATGTPYWDQQGHYNIRTDKFTEVNSDFLFTAKGNWGKFGIVGTLGGNIMYRNYSYMNSNSGNLVIPDFYATANGQLHTSTTNKERKQINSLYATASMSWDDYLFLDLTGRNDWSSTLPKDNASYFYPSVGVSWIFTQMMNKMDMNMGPISFGKIRASYAQVGNDADPYQLFDYYGINYDVKSGSFTASAKDFIANGNLKNESINSWELGLELKALDNRIGVDVAYYQKNAKDQILKVAIPVSSGYKYKLINAGNIENKGWEIALNATPLRTESGFVWDTQLNWSKNTNRVVELIEGTDEQVLSASSSLPHSLKIVAHVGGAYGDIYGTGYKRDEQGQMIIGTDGLPVGTDDPVLLGNNQPKWMMGWNNTFTYKDFTFNFAFDMRYGGDVYMGSIEEGARTGNLPMTLEGREGMVVPGVLADGTPNTKSVTAQTYWQGLVSKNIAEAFMYDATNIRLRELSIGYNMPKRILAKTPFTAIGVSFVARNLWMVYSKTKGFDPEAGYSNGNVQGFEFASMPTMRSLGFNVRVGF